MLVCRFWCRAKPPTCAGRRRQQRQHVEHLDVRSMSLRARLLLLVALATLVPAILLGVRFSQNRAAEIDAALTALAVQAGNIAQDLDEKIQGTAQLHFGLSRAGDIEKFNRAGCSAFLSEVLQAYPQYTGILTVSPDGRLVCDSLQTNRDLDLTDRKYFQEALVTADAVTLQPAFGRLTGISVLQIAYPARAASGELKFVLLASLNLKKFTELHRQRISSDITILLVDKDGTVLVAPPDPVWRAGASIANSDMFKSAAEQIGSRPFEVAGIDGRKKFWATAATPAVRDAGLYVMVGVSRENLVAAANRRLDEELAIIGAIALLLFGGVLALGELAIRRQVGRIADMAQKLAAGDLSTRIAPPHPGGELGQLMTELNAAAESLQRQHAAIDDLNQKLRKSRQEEARTKVFLDTVIEHIPLSISVKAPRDFTHDASGWQLMLVNKAYENLAGLSRDELIGRSARELFQAEAADVIVAADADALTSVEPFVNREFPWVSVKNVARVVSSKRVAIRDDTGKAQYLLTVLEDVTEMRRVEGRIAHLAHHDALTGLPNRAAFNACFAATLEKAAAQGDRFTLLSIDLDRFKEANDVYGHAAGDALLQEGARCLQAAAGGAFIARIGGDEFVLIVTDGEQPAAAATIADRLLEAFFDGFLIDGKRIQVGLGIGGAVYPDDGTDAKTLMANADAALYRAKAEPGASVLFFQPEMAVLRQERHDLQRDLRQAIDRNELTLHYQPQFRLTGEPVGFEALARWQCSTRGMVPPGTFIPIAEEYRLIIPLGEWALREACREAASWSRPLTIAVNVSPVQFHHGDLPSLVHSILLETGLAPGRLVLEITEGVLINDFSRAVSILRQLKALGVQIALDDFGKGYSSLSYLHSFAFDRIKIDRAFVSDLERNHHSMAIVRAVIGLGHSLKIPILAEGVETAAQRALLVREGCDEIQGYLTGRPFGIGHYAELIGGPAAGRRRGLGIAS
ncbi:MAG: EAL domain-containing protein [Pseudolabrys sp.]|nr:EAL domain-containing protein [Pseudolabrys sp.]